MLNVLVISEDAALRQAVADGLEAASPATNRGKVRWLSALPGPTEPPVDLLLVHHPTPGIRQMLDSLRPRPALTALAVDPAELGEFGGPGQPALGQADLLLWPCAPSLMHARCRQWASRLRDLRRVEQLEVRLARSVRNNSTLRRQSAKFAHQFELHRRNADELRRMLGRMDDLTRLSHQINSLQLEQIIDLCVGRVPELLGARLASLYLYDEANKLLRLQRHNHDYPIDETIRLADCPTSAMAFAIGRRQLLLINEPDWVELARQSVGRPNAEHYATAHCMIAPLLSGGRVVGVLNLADKADGLPFDPVVDLIPVRQLSELIGASIRNIELYQTVQQQAKCDGMTGLANHSTFIRELGREINRSRRYRAPLSLIMVDVDALKRINDLMGHQAGDRALQVVANQIGQSIRDSDLAARYGGDEFAILLPATPLESARAVAERIVQQIGSMPVVHNHLSSFVTVSVGTGQYDGNVPAEQFIDQVDRAMYQAKQAGKNRVAVCS